MPSVNRDWLDDVAKVVVALENGSQGPYHSLVHGQRVEHIPSTYITQILVAACMHGFEEVVKQVLESQAIDPSQASSAIQVATHYGHERVIRLIASHDLVDKSIEEKCFLDACSEGHIDVVKIFIENGVNPSVQSNWAIQVAALNDDVHLLELLLEDCRVDPSDNHNEAINIQIQNHGSEKFLSVLLADKRMDVGVGLNAALQYVCTKGYTQLLRTLLSDKRIDPLAPDPTCLLHQAVVHGNVATVALLLEDGRCNPGERNSEALSTASAHGHELVVDLLLNDSRVDPSAQACRAIKVAKSDCIRKMLFERVYSTVVFIPLARNIHSSLSKLQLKHILVGCWCLQNTNPSSANIPSDLIRHIVEAWCSIPIILKPSSNKNSERFSIDLQANLSKAMVSY